MTRAKSRCIGKEFYLWMTVEDRWHISTWDGLTVDALHDFLQLRINVFVVEQDCPYPELDDKDRGSIHLWSEDQEGVNAYLRIVPPGISYTEAAIGRVVVREDCRRSKLGHRLMEKGMQECCDRFGDRIRISAQKHLSGFYGRLGFSVQSDEYLEDGIPHVEMLYDKKETIGSAH